MQFQKISILTPPPQKVFVLHPAPLIPPGNSSLVSYFASKILAFKTPLILGISDDLGMDFFWNCSFNNVNEEAGDHHECQQVILKPPQLLFKFNNSVLKFATPYMVHKIIMLLIHPAPSVHYPRLVKLFTNTYIKHIYN